LSFSEILGFVPVRLLDIPRTGFIIIKILQDKSWRNRRSQKLDKMELLNLQSSLQNEIQAKQAISEELSKTRSELIAAQK